jgi:hypothetical protein
LGSDVNGAETNPQTDVFCYFFAGTGRGGLQKSERESTRDSREKFVDHAKPTPSRYRAGEICDRMLVFGSSPFNVRSE